MRGEIGTFRAAVNHAEVGKAAPDTLASVAHLAIRFHADHPIAVLQQDLSQAVPDRSRHPR